MSGIYSRAVVERKIEITQGEIQKVCGRLELAINSIYGVEVIGALSIPVEQQKELFGLMQKRINETTDYVNKKLEKSTKTLDELGATVDLKYSSPVSFTFDVPTPTAFKLLTIVQNADLLCRNYDLLWFSGSLEAADRTAIIGDVMKNLQNAIGYFVNLNQKCKSLSEAKNQMPTKELVNEAA